MLGNEIILSTEPRGVFLEGIMNGSNVLPGSLMALSSGEDPESGRHHWEPYDPAADGDRALIAILLADDYQGKTAEDAYSDNARCFLYCPAEGEELNVRVAASGTGTGDDQAIGQKYMASASIAGCLVETSGDPESEPFIAMEDVSDVVATGTLVHCLYTGR